MHSNKEGSMLSKFIYFTVFLMVLGALLVAALFYYYQKEVTKPIEFPSKNYELVIKRGSSVDDIADVLYDNKLIANPYILKAYLFLNDDKVIQAGLYKIPEGNVNLVALVDLMQKGSFSRTLTLLNGWRLEQYKDYLAKEMGEEFAEKFIKSSYTKEGFMYPDTYIVDYDVKPELFASQLRNTFDTKVRKKINLASNKHGLSEDEVVIMASILEREENDPEAMKIIAGILMNRIKQGMRLQVDATVQYALGTPKNWWPVVRGSDIDNTESEYNTYKNKGLPPGPICNPTFAAIDAVINSTDSDYLFYMTGKDGVTRYAKTLEEHNENVATYLK